MLPGFYLQHDDFAHDLFAIHGKSLRWRWSFVSRASLVRPLHAASEVGISDWLREILQFPRSLHS